MYLVTQFSFSQCRNHTESAELVTATETSLSLQDILPLQSKNYDKNRAPKMLGQPTVVCKSLVFHIFSAGQCVQSARTLYNVDTSENLT